MIRWIPWILLVAALAMMSGCCDGESTDTGGEVEATTEAPEAVTEEPEEDTRPPVINRREAKETPRPDATEVDKAVSRWIGSEFGGGRQEDVDPDGPYRIDLIQGEGADAVNGMEVDIDRDGNFDERWSIEGAGVTREVSPDDDGNYSQKYAWIMQRWINA